MKGCVFGIHDDKLGAFRQLFFQQTRAMAIRTFQQEVNRDDSEFGTHAADFSLFCLADVDMETGDLVPCRDSLGSALEFVKRPLAAVGGN